MNFEKILNKYKEISNNGILSDSIFNDALHSEYKECRHGKDCSKHAMKYKKQSDSSNSNKDDSNKLRQLEYCNNFIKHQIGSRKHLSEQEYNELIRRSDELRMSKKDIVSYGKSLKLSPRPS